VESKTAAYLGYTNTSDLRCIVLCWPVLSAVVQINKNPKYTNARGAFKILNDDLESYKNIPDPAAKFPLTGSDAKKKTAANKRLAAILSKMIEDFELMSTLSPAENKTRQEAAMASYKKEFPDRSNVPLLSASKCLGPTLGPLEDESALEAINRCWMLTKYFKYCQQMNAKAFQVRFPSDGDIKGTKISPAMVPAWMRPKRKTANPKSTKSEAMIRADSLSKKKFTFRHATGLDDPDCKEDLEENFEKGFADGHKRLSTVRQDFWIDPRLYNSVTSLRDQLRRQLRCHQFRTNLANVIVKFKRNEKEGMSDEQADLLTDDWTVVKSVLCDESNDDFDFMVGLNAGPYELANNVFEDFDVPPHLQAFFKPIGVGSSRDVATNSEGIQANAIRVFGPPEDTSEADNIDPGERILAYLDTGLSLGTGPHDIGAAPDPLLRFHGNKEAMMAFYDGMDVTQPNELRKWQQSVLVRCSSLADKSYSVDKPARPSSMTKAQKAAVGGKLTDVQKAAIEESSFLGSTAAQGREDVDKGDEPDVSIFKSTFRFRTLLTKNDSLKPPFLMPTMPLKLHASAALLKKEKSRTTR
jgi:hypothetical protein